MAILHDAYLFSTDGFADFLKSRNDERSNDKEQIVEEALEYMQDDFVKVLADNYGSWDYHGVKTHLSEYSDDKSRITTFTFVLALYKHLSQFTNHPSGLAEDWRTLLNMPSISQDDRQVLVHGHSFDNFIKHWKIRELDLWEKTEYEIAPPSTSSNVGYLDYDEIASIYQRLSSIEQKADNNELIWKVRDMLQFALKSNVGICVILSG